MKQMSSVHHFKGLAVADLLELGQKEPWVGEKVNFSVPKMFFHADAILEQGYSWACSVRGGLSGSLATQCCLSPKRSPLQGPGSADPWPLSNGNHSISTLAASHCVISEPRLQAQALIFFILGMAAD